MPAACAAPIFALTLALAAPVHADATNDLFKAAHGGTASEVKAALSAGADPAARDIAGETPFDHAENDAASKGTDACRPLNEGRFE